MSNIQSISIEEQVRISVVGWLSIIISGIGFYFTFFSILESYIVVNNFEFLEMQNSILSSPENAGYMEDFTAKQNQVLLLFYILLIIWSVGLLTGIGILKKKTWALIIFSILSTVLTILIVGGLVYFILHLQDFKTDFAEWGGVAKVQNIKMLSYGIFFVIIARTLLRTTFYLNRKKISRSFE